jgi:hypothetical protein
VCEYVCVCVAVALSLELSHATMVAMAIDSSEDIEKMPFEDVLKLPTGVVPFSLLFLSLSLSPRTLAHACTHTQGCP